MTDENTGTASSTEANQESVITQTGSGSGDGSIPKYRLDELIAEKRILREQNEMLAQTLRQVTQPNHQTAPEKEPEWVLRLKEENPLAYQAHKATNAQVAKLQRATQQNAAAQFELHEQIDRKNLVDNFGDDAGKYLHKIEDILKQERDSGNFRVNRGLIYQNLKGAEAIESSRKKPTPQVQQQVVAAQSQSQDAPSQSVNTSGALRPSSAGGVSKATDSLAELEKRLENYEF